MFVRLIYDHLRPFNILNVYASFLTFNLLTTSRRHTINKTNKQVHITKQSGHSHPITSHRSYCSRFLSVDQYHSITTLSNTFKPFLFHSIFTQNPPFHHHIPFLSDALFPEQSGLHILQIPIYNIPISPFHGIPSNPMPHILSPLILSHSPPSCCLCSLLRC